MNFKTECKYCGKKYIEKKVDGLERAFFVADCDCEEKRADIRERAEKRRYYKLYYRYCRFTKRYIGKRLKNLKCEHIETAKNFVDNFKPFKSKGLFLIGKAGNGKTTLAISIAKELFAKNIKVSDSMYIDSNVNILFMSYADYLNEMQNASNFDNKMTIDELIKKWIKHDLLIIDDFGREKYTGKRLENTFLFFDKLYNNCTTIIVTANPENIVKLKEYPEFNAIFDRLAEQTTKLIFKNQSFRRDKE